MTASLSVLALEPFNLTGEERGQQLGPALEIWHDPTAQGTVADARLNAQRGVFRPLPTMASTGFQAGAFWGNVVFHNPAQVARTIHLEYVDHQLISMNAFQSVNGSGDIAPIAQLSMYGPFNERPVPHHRFVVPVTVGPQQSVDVLIRYGSEGHGFVFPNLRVWEPEALRSQQLKEVGLMGFLVGGLVLMSLAALFVGVATREKLFFIYSFYALSKAAMWWTMVGLTRQFFLPDSFHWQYISISGALVIAAGTWFARQFLQTRFYTPRLDSLLVALQVCAALLLVLAVMGLASMSVLLITLILLMYPFVTLAGVVRWSQGMREAGFFALAWSFLVAALLGQALRDLGYIEHNLINYYWPVVASYAEMAVILIAMGLSLSRLRIERDTAEKRYLHQVMTQNAELETQVQERTRELELAKSVAEEEARIDPLTGANNRRSFFQLAEAFEGRSCQESPFSVLMFDIDHFKAINDSFGHTVGDQALCLFSNIIMNEIRETDVFGRLGGEEFAVVLAGSEDKVMQVAERLREKVGRLSLRVDDQQVAFTTSVGVAHYTGSETIETLLFRADAALYEAKQEGRNRVKLSLLVG